MPLVELRNVSKIYRLGDEEIRALDDITAAQIRNGRAFRVSPFGVPKTARYVKALSPSGDLLAIGEARLPHLYHPVLVL